MTLPRMLPKRPKRDGRLRCPAHLKWVRQHVCSVGSVLCEGPIEAAHVRTGTDGGTGMKPGDEWVISLCARHHRLQHQLGECEFEKEHCIDMKQLAIEFAKASPALKRRAAHQQERRR